LLLFPYDHNKLPLPAGTTLDRFIMRCDFSLRHGRELSQLLRDTALAAKIVNCEINRLALSTLRYTAARTCKAEDQQKLDVIANIRHPRLCATAARCAPSFLSEEDDEMIQTGNNQGYVAAIDPFGRLVGRDAVEHRHHFFSIYRRVSPTGRG
jgi:fructose-1,6-bisphosphatase I